MRNCNILVATTVILCYVHLCAGFSTLLLRDSYHAAHSPVRSNRITRVSTNLNSVHLSEFSSSSPSEIFVLSFDGTVANTAEWRANIAIDVACKIWPHLKEYIGPTSGEGNYQEREWLVNKMTALSHAMQSDNDGMMGCDSVLLARLLLEEQLLDEGRSVGKTGKYGSKFHPSSSSVGEVARDRGKYSPGSRPLTVGEISANWSDGACLRETTRIKYNIDRKDPLPIIKEYLCIVHNENDYPLPKLNPAIGDILSNCDNKVYILLGHESHLASSEALLIQNSIPIITKIWTDAADITGITNNGQVDNVIVVSPNHDTQDHSTIIENIVMNADAGSSVHVIHSAISTLHKAKKLFGDDSPRLLNGFGKCAFKKEVELKLCLPTWIDSADPQKENDAEMDPWMNLIEEFELTELLSARIIVND